MLAVNAKARRFVIGYMLSWLTYVLFENCLPIGNILLHMESWSNQNIRAGLREELSYSCTFQTCLLFCGFLFVQKKKLGHFFSCKKH